MSIANSTKQAFADALKLTLNTKELSAVRVQELCRLCGTERPTFYYHFRDKHDLIAWIYEQDVARTLAMTGGVYGEKQLEELLRIMQTEQVFYRKAFADSTQNALLPYVQQMILSAAESVLQVQLSKENLGQEDKFVINCMAYSWCRGLVDWIEGKYDLSAREYARLMFRYLSWPNIRDLPANTLR